MNRSLLHLRIAIAAFFASTMLSWLSATTSFMGAWGSQDAEAAPLLSPRGISVDIEEPTPPPGKPMTPFGNFYVADTDSNRIQKFTGTGTFLLLFGGPAPGIGSNQFNHPEGVDVFRRSDGTGLVAVGDTGNNRIKLHRGANGNFIRQWFGTVPNTLNSPRGVSFSANARVYVADTGNNRVQVFDSLGTWIDSVGTRTPGSGDGQFIAPEGVAVDTDGFVYVADTGNHRIQKFNSSGDFVAKRGGPAPGSGNNQFNGPQGIVAVNGVILVADTNNNRIQQFDAGLNFVNTYNMLGLAGPQGVSLNSMSEAYVADTNNNRFVRFSLSNPIPTVSEMWLIAMLLLLLSGGAFLFHRRRLRASRAAR